MKKAVALFLGLCVAALVWAQNTTLSRTVTDGQVREQLINHKGQNPARDSDGDGIPDVIESQLGTDPTKTDTDGDGFPDGIEIAYGLDPKRSDAGVEIVYVATKLPMPPNYAGAEITDISNSGFLGGYAYSYSNSHEDTAVRWNLNTGSVEIASSSLYSYGQSINDAGTVVGDIDPDPNFNRAMRWIHGTAPTRIGSTGAFTYFAWDVNDAGDVVGEDFKSGAFKLSGSNGIISSLLAPGGYRRPVAYAVNDAGQVLGRAENSNTGVRVGIIWNGTSPTLMLAGPNEAGSPVTFNQPSDISNAGHALGMTDIWTGKPGVWAKTTGLKMLPLDTGNPRTFAWKINGFGEVIGDMGGMPTLWRPNSNESSGWEIVDLSLDILDAEIAYTFYAYSINDKGQIAGSYLDLDDFELYPVVLTPVVRSRLLVDANRDGKISTDGSDVTSAAQPFRFWINDDDDVDSGDLDDVEKAPISRSDWEDDIIDGIRDLEDFARLDINISGLQDAVLNGTLKIGLKWKNVSTGTPAVKIWRNLSSNGGTEYLYEETIARQHLTLIAPGHVTGVMPYLIPQIFWQQSGLSATQPCGYLLFEGCSEGKGELVVTIHNADGSEIAEASSIWLELKNIKRMYQRVKALADGGDNITIPSDLTGPDDNNIPNPVMSWSYDSNSYPFEAPVRETKTLIVSVHGWNQTYERSTMYAETAFKRLWHRGYRGRFVSFRWPTYVGLLTYNNSEYKAWKCGESLKQFLDSIPRGSGGFTVNMIAHSMGNIVAGEALRRGASVSNYALWNAAVPSICYDDRDALDQGWGYTHPNDDPDAYTRSLSYRKRFDGAGGRLINFFLEGDSALGLWRLNNSISKPQRWTSGFVAGYGYNRAEISGRKLYLEFWTALGRYIVDAHEAMSYAVKSPTLAVGADPGLVDSSGLIYGSISTEVDMDAEYAFDKDHSAQFLYPLQKTKALYDQTLIELRLPILP